MANKLPPVCPQKLPKLDATTSSGGPGGSSSISKGRYNQLKRLFPYLKVESEDCLYLNLYVPRLGKIFGVDVTPHRDVISDKFRN